MPNIFFGGLDFGTSGARISIININKELTYTNSVPYENGFKNKNFSVLQETRNLHKQSDNLTKEQLKEFSILFIMIQDGWDSESKWGAASVFEASFEFHALVGLSSKAG